MRRGHSSVSGKIHCGLRPTGLFALPPRLQSIVSSLRAPALGLRTAARLIPMGAAYLVLSLALLAAATLILVRSEQPEFPQLSTQTASEGDAPVSPTEAIGYFAHSDLTGTRLRAGKLAEGAHWLHIEIEIGDKLVNPIIKLESLRIVSGKFWIAKKESVEESPIVVAETNWRPVRNGIAVELPGNIQGPSIVLGRIESETFNRPRVFLIPEKNLSDLDFQFERTGGVLLGALAMLAAFSFLIAIFNRDTEVRHQTS